MFNFGKKKNMVNVASKSLGTLITDINTFDDDDIAAFDTYMSVATINDLIEIYSLLPEEVRNLTFAEVFADMKKCYDNLGDPEVILGVLKKNHPNCNLWNYIK